MSTEQTPSTNISDGEIIERRDRVTFAVVAFTQLTTISLLEAPGFSTRELKLWDDEDAHGKGPWEIAYYQYMSGLWTIRYAPGRSARRWGLISDASKAKIADLENMTERTLDLIEDSVDISNEMLLSDSKHDPNSGLEVYAVLKPFIRDYAEYTQKGKLELGNINSQAICQELAYLMPSNPLARGFQTWRSLVQLYVWAADPEPGAGVRFCERVNVARQMKMSGTFP